MAIGSQSAQAAAPQTAAPAAVPQGGYLAGGYGETIAAAAESQIGSVQDCTMLVTHSLAKAGIFFHGAPGEYQKLGSITSQPQRGDLIYYANGGMGVPHIAVYVGGYQPAVHGGYNGDLTVRTGLNMGQSGSFHPTYYVHVGGGPSIVPAPAPQPAPAPAPAAIQRVSAVSSAGVHVVAPGETMGSIAASAGLSDWHSLWSANPQVTNPNAIYAGQQLNLPAAASSAPASGSHTHIVGAGETLSSIAASMHLGDWHALWHANPQIGDPNTIFVGQQLALP